MKKNLFLLGFALLFAISIANFSYGADNIQELDNITVVNSNYNGILTDKTVEKMIENDKEDVNSNNFLSYKSRIVNSSFGNHYYYENKNDAANYIKEKMTQRENQVTLRFESKKLYNIQLAKTIVEKAISEDLAKDSDEGDYLAWSYGGYQARGEYGYNKKTNKYYYHIYYTFTYYTNLQQEKALDNKIQKFMKKINIKKESQYSIIKQINDFICDNVDYDYKHLPDPSYKLQFTAYAALLKNKAVCQGYATLYYRLLKECGINNRILVSKTHSWNLINVGNLYYNVDAVWNDSLNNDKYLLSGSTDFINDFDHIRNAQYTTTQFNSKYPTSKTKFKVKLNKVTNLKVKKTTSNEIILSWNKQNNITGYKIYKYNYERECWEYYKQVKGYKSNSCKISKLKESTTYKFRVRSYAMINHKKQYGQYSDSLKTITAPKKTSIKSIKSNSNRQIKIGWKKVLKGTGYQIQYSTKKSFIKNVVSFRVKDKYSNYKKIKNLKKGKKYYFRVRSYKYYKGNRYYSSWSEVKSIKCK